MWENMVQPDNPQLKLRHKHFACRINKDTKTHSEYVILIAVPRQQRFRERAPILGLHAHFLSCCAPSRGTRK